MFLEVADRYITGLLSLLLMAVFVTSCEYISAKKNAQIVAECYGKYLYVTDLEDIVPNGSSQNDSIALTKHYIDNWIMQQVMLKQAEDNLTEKQKDFRDQIESYRNSLIVYAYESELIRQKLDTSVTDAEIESFYLNNQQNFQLRENIVRVKYVKIPAGENQNKLVNQISKLIKSDDEEESDQLMEICNQSLIICYSKEDQWIRFDDLLQQVPIKTDDQEKFLVDREFYEVSDTAFTYLVRFVDYKTKEGVSPLSFERENIRNMIINRRKIDLINQMQQQVYQKAVVNKEFTIY